MKDVKESYYDQFLSGKSSKYVLFYILLGGFVLLFFPLIFTKINLIDFGQDKPGEIGDIINGVTAPFIGFGAIIVTFYAFWIQFKANIKLRDDIEFSKFENKYYELLKLHSSNVQEMNISNNIYGRKCFVEMFKELSFIYSVLYNIVKENNEKKIFNGIYSDLVLCNIAYIIFFYGIGNESNKTLDYLIESNDRKLVELARAKLAEIQDQFMKWEYKKNRHRNDNFPYELYFIGKLLFINGPTLEIELSYYPFDGHASRLSHYFRHLFQTVKFIDNEITLYGKEIDKENYLKTIRAQLSNHEQLLLYYNSLSTFGSKWCEPENDLIAKYRLIHNIPLSLADFGLQPKKKYAKNVTDWSNRIDKKQFFEWDELINNKVLI